MSGYRRIEIIEPSCPSLRFHGSSIYSPKPFPSFAHPLLHFTSPFQLLDTVADLPQIEQLPFCSSSYDKRIHHRGARLNDLYLESLCHRVTALEFSYDRLVKDKLNNVDRKYTWTAQIKGEEKKKKEKKEKKKEETARVVKSYKWTAEINGKGGPVTRTYTFKESNGYTEGESGGSEKGEKKKKNSCNYKDKHRVKIEEVADHGAFELKQAFAKRDNGKGKKKELSPLDAANRIQMNFKAYLIRRSQSLRALRELAIAKTKLKGIRAMFRNFAFRRHLSCDAEERQRFSQKITVLLLTVDAIQGADLMVRSAKRCMVDELEAMLDVVDPQPACKSLSTRRTFGLPISVLQSEIAAGVAKVVRMLDQEEDDTDSAFEVCV